MRGSLIFGVVFTAGVLFVFFVPVFPYTFASAGPLGSEAANVSLSYYVFSCGTFNGLHYTVAGGGSVPASQSGYQWTCG